MPGPLAGLRVLELARILAGPWAGQILADLGADVVKVERPGAGDDTRGWGPPFVEGADGTQMSAAYYHSCNRGKRSVAVDFETEDGRRIVRKLAARSDIVIENFKTGGLAKFGLDYKSLVEGEARHHLLLGHRLRAGRPLFAPRRLRPAGAGHGRHHGPHRPARRRADARRRRLRGRDDRHLFGGRDHGGAERAQRHRQGQLHRHGAARHPGRGARQPGLELSGQRQGAEAHGQRASGGRALSGVSGGRRPRHHRLRQRHAVRAADRAAGRARDGRRTSATAPMRAAW